jgi:ribulose-5-phosphate 4-epimerase/fuculose-1-phosphate aldolase
LQNIFLQCTDDHWSLVVTESQAREEICRVGRSLFERGYVHATAGNISVRLDDGFLITPTDACLGFLDPARLSKLGLQGQQISGDKASKTIALHRQIYAAASKHDASTRCVIHTHSTHCVALSLNAVGPELMGPITPYFVMKVGHVPIVTYHRPGSTEAAAEVASLIAHYAERGTPIRAVMLPRLGPNVWHDTPATAMATLEELEETARLMLLAPATPALPESALEELRQIFGALW